MAPRRIRVKNIFKLTRSEQAIERAIGRGEYRPVSKEEFNRTVEELKRWRKDAVLNIRVNSIDLANIKKKAKKAGIPYQTFISGLIHKYAAS
jgi:predicted DNA binding CopG/RHH family protein